MEALMRAMAGEELPEKFPLPLPVAITRENVGEFDWAKWAWLGE